MSAFSLIISNQHFSKADILSWNGDYTDAYTRDIVQLCKDWFEGKELFELKTSGSTGPPKTIFIHRSQIEASARTTIQFFNLTPGNAVVCPLNIHTVGGQMMLYRSIIGQLKLYIIPPSKSLEGIDTTITYAFMPISALQLFEILTHHPEKITLLNKLNHLLIGGSSISDALQTQIQKKLSCKVWHSYGMTETVSHIAMRSVHPINDEAYTILDDIEIKQDNRACLNIKGAVTNDVWLQTNDVVECINNKQFVYVGRVDFTVNSGGIKIQVEPIEKTIDSIFIEFGIINHFFICGIPDDALGEKLVLLIDNTISLTKQQTSSIEERLKSSLKKYHLPKIIETCTFTYTPSGKINRKETIDSFIKKGFEE